MERECLNGVSMKTTKQTFYNGDTPDFEAEHEPKYLDMDYFITFRQNGKEVRVCLYNLKSVMRTANKNIKEIMREKMN